MKRIAERRGSFEAGLFHPVALDGSVFFMPEG
jgi:hypothetical protein